MSDKLTKQDIDDLIYIGKIPLGKLVYEGKFFSEFRKKNHINRTHWDIWEIGIDLTDKKNNSNKINLILLKKIGQTILNQEYSVKNLNRFLKNELID